MKTIGLIIEKDRLPAESAEEETKLPKQQNKAPKKKSPKAKKPPKEKEIPEVTARICPQKRPKRRTIPKRQRNPKMELSKFYLTVWRGSFEGSDS